MTRSEKIGKQSITLVIVLQAKHVIYKCKFYKRLPTLSAFIRELTFRYEIEGYNAKVNCEISKFNLKWLFYKSILEGDHTIN